MAAPDHDLVTAIRHALADAADPALAASMQTYMKSEMPYRGIPSPVLTAVLRPLLAGRPLDQDTWEATLLELWDGAGFREERYAALALARHRLHREHRRVADMALYEHLIRTGAWWDLVDETATHLVRDELLAHPESCAGTIREWSVADDLWVRRAAIICQVGTGDRCDQALLAEVLEANLDGSTRTTSADSAYGREFFVRKAVGWALRDHARTDPDWVLAFVEQHHDRLSGLSRREALKHIGRGRSGPDYP